MRRDSKPSPAPWSTEAVLKPAEDAEDARLKEEVEAAGILMFGLSGHSVSTVYVGLLRVVSARPQSFYGMLRPTDLTDLNRPNRPWPN